MKRLLIAPKFLQTLHRHAEATYPEECCGFLIGRSLPDEPATVLVERVLAAHNDREDSRHNRFVIGPQMVLAAHKQARAQQLDVLGYYHSHPDAPARPSELDREHAWPDLSYLIVSVREGRVVDTRSWRLRDDRERFEEEMVDTMSMALAAVRSRAGRKPRSDHRPTGDKAAGC